MIERCALMAIGTKVLKNSKAVLAVTCSLDLIWYQQILTDFGSYQVVFFVVQAIRNFTD